jgi:hypothetical protein
MHVFFSFFLYMYSRWRFNYQEGRDVIPFAGLNPSHFYTCSKPGPGFNVMCRGLLLMFNELR